MDLSVIIFAITGIVLLVSIIKVLVALVKNLMTVIYGLTKCKTPVAATVAGRWEEELDREEAASPDRKYSYIYQFTFNGAVYRVRSKTWTLVPFRVGNTVTLYVDESNPNHIFEKGMILANTIVDLLACVIIIVLCGLEFPFFLEVMNVVLGTVGK